MVRPKNRHLDKQAFRASITNAGYMVSRASSERKSVRNGGKVTKEHAVFMLKLAGTTKWRDLMTAIEQIPDDKKAARLKRVTGEGMRD
jgi:hypothetical protein